jgi:DNA-binding CsgD family transcriptional regulator
MARFDDQTELTRTLFADAAAKVEAPWATFLDQLREVTQADGAGLCVDPEGASLWTRGDCPVIDAPLRGRLRIDRVYAQDGLPLTDWTKGFLRVVKARIDATSHVTVWLHRGLHRKDFRSSDGQILSALTPFLGQAAQMSLTLRVERTEAALSETLAARLGAGWIMLDRSGVVQSLSGAAREWSEREGLRITDRRRLEFPDADVAQEFRTGFAAVVAGEGTVTIALPNVELVLSRDDQFGEGSIVGSLRTMPIAGALSNERIAAHFGLSRSEARLLAQLCDGHTLRSAAEVLGWTEETARSTSKVIFARLGVSGQPAMIRRIMGSGVWF